jgi:hypothetical protein
MKIHDGHGGFIIVKRCKVKGCRSWLGHIGAHHV